MKKKYFYLPGILICLLTSCTPHGGDSGTMFNVNLLASQIVLGSDTTVLLNDTSVFVDGDKLNFVITQTKEADFTTVELEIIPYLAGSSIEYVYIGNFPFNYNTNQFDSTNLLFKYPESINALNSNTLLNNSTGNNYVWNNAAGFTTILYKDNDRNNILESGLKRNIDQYLVFRKLKGTSYQYYWLKIRRDELFPNAGVYTYKILNGKYKLDNITTGQ